MNRFKVGDRVTAADSYHVRHTAIKPGTLGTVLETDYSDRPYCIGFDSEQYHWFDDSDLLPFEPYDVTAGCIKQSTAESEVGK